ncbi:MAG TPA: hypothetical protein VFP82_01190, partial [Chthoniobacterales bacterium]|nr:hypothetical protein [Chthoniobacterales bacterium]
TGSARAFATHSRDDTVVRQTILSASISRSGDLQIAPEAVAGTIACITKSSFHPRSELLL